MKILCKNTFLYPSAHGGGGTRDEKQVIGSLNFEEREKTKSLIEDERTMQNQYRNAFSVRMVVIVTRSTPFQ